MLPINTGILTNFINTKVSLSDLKYNLTFIKQIYVCTYEVIELFYVNRCNNLHPLLTNFLHLTMGAFKKVSNKLFLFAIFLICSCVKSIYVFNVLCKIELLLLSRTERPKYIYKLLIISLRITYDI